MENYFVIHGSFGSPFGNWFSWLYDFIEGEGKVRLCTRLSCWCRIPKL